MKKRICILATVFVALSASLTLSTGCSDLSRPMDEQVLVAVIVDLQLLEARRELVADAHPTLRDSILAAHGITHDELYDAINWYLERPDDYVSVYNRVIDSLSAEEAELEETGVIGRFAPP